MINTRWALQWEELYRQIAQLNQVEQLAMMWDVYAVGDCGSRDKVNSEPYDSEQVAELLCQIGMEFSSLVLIPYESNAEDKSDACF